MTHSVLLYVPGLPLSVEAFLPIRGMASLAAALLNAGHQTRIADYGNLEALRQLGSPGLRAAVREKPDLLHGTAGWRRWLNAGPSKEYLALMQESLDRRCQTVTQHTLAIHPLDFAVFWVERREDVREAVRVAQCLRAQRPAMRMGVAGPYLYGHGAAVLAENGVFDCAASLDEEVSIPAWAERINTPEKWEEVPNLLYALKGKVYHNPWQAPADLDSLPMPCYAPEIYPAAANGQKLNLFTVEQSRWAYSPAVMVDGAQPMRFRSAGRVCDEMERLHRTLNARAFHIAGEFVPSAQIDALSYALMARGMNIVYGRAAHCASLHPASAALLASSGGQSVEFQIDTGSQRLLEDFYGHLFGVTITETVLNACRDAGLFTVTKFTYPCPHDDYHTRAETIRLIRRTRPDGITLGAPWVSPVSRWWSRAPEFGFQIDHDRYAAWLAGADKLADIAEGRLDAPYRMAGWPAGRAKTERASLETELNEEGFDTHTSGVLGLMARIAGYDGQESVYSAEILRSLRHWDVSALKEIASEFNARAAAPTNTIPFRPFVPVLAAVGN